jgi:hypothetical protein
MIVDCRTKVTEIEFLLRPIAVVTVKDQKMSANPSKDLKFVVPVELSVIVCIVRMQLL